VLENRTQGVPARSVQIQEHRGSAVGTGADQPRRHPDSLSLTSVVPPRWKSLTHRSWPRGFSGRGPALRPVSVGDHGGPAHHERPGELDETSLYIETYSSRLRRCDGSVCPARP